MDYKRQVAEHSDLNWDGQVDEYDDGEVVTEETDGT